MHSDPSRELCDLGGPTACRAEIGFAGSRVRACMSEPMADSVVLSYPDGLSGWGRDQIDTDRYRGYFRRVLGTVSVGDVREEFVDVGCCGDSLDVPFRVVAITVDGEPAETAVVAAGTEVAYETHDGEVDGGWCVQSAAGPNA